MSFFGKIFGSEDVGEEQPSFWKKLENEEEIETIIAESYQKKVVVFKHSTRCFISKTVLKSFEKEVINEKPDADFYYLDLLKFRNISNALAEKFDLRHESPQLLVVQNGKLINNGSHQAITTNLI